mgnify:CR=1 FL=1
MYVRDFIPPETFPIQTSLGKISIQPFHDKEQNKTIISVSNFFEGTKTIPVRLDEKPYRVNGLLKITGPQDKISVEAVNFECKEWDTSYTHASDGVRRKILEEITKSVNEWIANNPDVFKGHYKT